MSIIADTQQPSTSSGVPANRPVEKFIIMSDTQQLSDSINEKPRKRVRHKENDKSFQYKRAVQKLEERRTASGKVIAKIKFKPQHECCKRNCYSAIPVERQNQIFTNFYSLDNWSKKILMLRSLIKKNFIKKNLNPVISLKNRKSIVEYVLIDENGVERKVCLNFFQNCLQISNKRMSTVLNSVIPNPNALETRGSFRPKMSNIEDQEFLTDFIKKIPTYQSHYSTNCNTKFLDPDLNIVKMYKEYCLVAEKANKNKLSEFIFRKIFNTKFNLRFKQLKTDTCKTCDKLEIKLSETECAKEKENIKRLKSQHLMKVNFVKSNFKKSLLLGREEVSTCVLTFDLQRTLPLPCLPTSVAYYKRKLWFYNLGIYDEIRKQSYNYVWVESTASRGADEVGSCLIYHFRNFISKETNNIILNSDACGGQNRNIKISLLLKYFIEPKRESSSIKHIEQRYYVSGHSYNSCDRCFGVIEKKRKKTQKFLIAQDYVKIIGECNFNCVEMKSENFYSSASLLSSITNRKKL